MKLRGYVGLAAKAGRIASGEETIVRAVRNGKAKRLLLDKDAGPNTRDRLERLARHYGLPLTYMIDLGGAIGHASRMAAALTDEGLNRAMESAINENRGGVLEE